MGGGGSNQHKDSDAEEMNICNDVNVQFLSLKLRSSWKIKVVRLVRIHHCIKYRSAMGCCKEDM